MNVNHGFYRRRPLTLRAWQYDGRPLAEHGPPWLRTALARSWFANEVNAITDGEGQLQIRTYHGVVVVMPGEWIIEGVLGELYPCTADVFQQLYYEAPEIGGDL